MNREFWISRWAEDRIGFHRDRVHPALARFHGQVAPGPPGRVLVPLCGKSHDLVWLADRGHTVLGVDLSPIAARSLAEEHGLDFTSTEGGPFTRLRAGRIEFRVGDFFDLDPEEVGRFPLLYDRAALIALPAELRGPYAEHTQKLLEYEANILLITIDYGAGLNSGPPFAVTESEVRALYAGFRIEKLDERDCLDEEPRFRERGLDRMTEVTYHLHRLSTR